MKHASGPYTVQPDAPSHGCCLCIVDAKGLVVARTPEVDEYDNEEQHSIDLPNAILLAAAPEMLKALRYALDCVERGDTTDMQPVRDAIEQATGEKA